MQEGSNPLGLDNHCLQIGKTLKNCISNRLLISWGIRRLSHGSKNHLFLTCTFLKNLRDGGFFAETLLYEYTSRCLENSRNRN